MPRLTAPVLINDLSGGFVTEQSQIAQSPNIMNDVVNLQPDRRKPVHSPRLGVDRETGAVSLSATRGQNTFKDDALSSYVWQGVAGEADLTFIVLQNGRMVEFYVASDGSISAGKLSFEIDLSEYKAPDFTKPVRTAQCDFSSGSSDGYLFIVSSAIEPLIVEYDPNSGNFSVTENDIEVRDFEGIDDGVAPNEDVDIDGPDAATHTYNLKNSGWVEGVGGYDPLEDYRENALSGSVTANPLPRKSKPWWIVKKADGTINHQAHYNFHTGTSLAPSGHYILGAFRKDRSSVSGVSGLLAEVNKGRPQATEFYAGRVWYAGHSGGSYLYSQILKDRSDAAKCYQRNDPTSEDASDLLANDGGEGDIPEAQEIVALKAAGPALLLFARNGVWAISGPNGGDFRPTDFQVTKISSFGCLSRDSVVSVGASVFYASTQGIHVVSPPETGFGLVEQSITDQRIAEYYQDIPATSKRYLQGVHHPEENRVYWYFSSTDQGTEYLYRKNTALFLSLDLGAWYKFGFKAISGGNSPYIQNVFVVPDRTMQITDAPIVVDEEGDTVLEDSTGNTVVAGANSLGDATSSTYRLMYMCNTWDWDFTFYEHNAVSRKDFATDATAAGGTAEFIEVLAYLAFLISEDMRLEKQVPHVYVFHEKTTGASLKMRVAYDWNSSGPKLGREFETYRATADFDGEVYRSKHMIRGSGRSAIQIRFYNDNGSPFSFLGIQTDIEADRDRS